jgi:hypothetical protein
MLNDTIIIIIIIVVVVVVIVIIVIIEAIVMYLSGFWVGAKPAALCPLDALG